MQKKKQMQNNDINNNEYQQVGKGKFRVIHRCVSLGKNTSSLTSELMVPGQDAVANNYNCQNPHCIYFILSYTLWNISAEAETKHRRSVFHHRADPAGVLLLQSKYLGEIMLADWPQTSVLSSLWSHMCCFLCVPVDCQKSDQVIWNPIHWKCTHKHTHTHMPSTSSPHLCTLSVAHEIKVLMSSRYQQMPSWSCHRWPARPQRRGQAASPFKGTPPVALSPQIPLLFKLHLLLALG